MQWTKALEQSVRTGTPETACGSACYFVRLTPTMGLKLYATPIERDASYVAQSVAAELEIAPSVGQCVELEGLSIPADQAPGWWKKEHKEHTPHTLYGFLTELCEPDIQFDAADIDIAALQRIMVDAGFHATNDMWGDNLGYTKDGKLVLLDWDPRFGADLLTKSDMESISQFFGDYAPWNH